MIQELPSSAAKHDIPRIERVRIRNYRALKDVELAAMTPLTVFLGPNGSGKSTLIDVFAFLSECFSVGLRKAWDRRGRFKELRTRDADGPIGIELEYRERPDSPAITYRLSIAENGGPYVAEESLHWRVQEQSRLFRFLDFREGVGEVVAGEMPDERDPRTAERLDSRETLAVGTLGQLARHPRVSALRRFIAGWYLSLLSAESARAVPEAGPQEQLSTTGDNLANVVQYLKEQHPRRLEQIFGILARRVPQLERVDAEPLPDGRLLLMIKDVPFDRPVPARFASDGTLKLLAYLTVLHDPQPPQLIAIEEPENHLHPRLLAELVEECRNAAARAQLMVTTHSPFFVNGLRPNELWLVQRDARGHTHCRRASDIRGVLEMMHAGAKLGHLWMEGYLDPGNGE